MRPRILLTAPNIHPEAVGEEFVAWKWAEALSDLVDLTVFSFQRRDQRPLEETLPKARVVTEPMPSIFARWPRFEAMAKPHYFAYMRAVRRALNTCESEIDLVHQIMPQAARYPIPFRQGNRPFVVGPLGGALPTPPAFRNSNRRARWFTHLRAFDGWRLRHDRWLRRGYMEADLVLGVAPYVQDLLSAVPLKRFAPVLELGIDSLPPLPRRHPRTRNVRLLHVGRGVRTKGLRDVIDAMYRVRHLLPGMTLTSAGGGEEIAVCKAHAAQLGIADRVTFLGQVSRAKVEELYAEADIFVFPSFRESAGNVIYEAMRWGLPVITAARGGPDWIVDDTTGVRIPVTDPGTYAQDIADAVEALALDPARRRAFGQSAREKLNREGLWPLKAAGLTALYAEVLNVPSAPPADPQRLELAV